MGRTKDIHESEIILEFKTKLANETKQKIQEISSSVRQLTSEVGASKKSIGTMKSWSSRTDKDANGDIDNRRYAKPGEAILGLGDMSDKDRVAQQRKAWREQNNTIKEKQSQIKEYNNILKNHDNILDSNTKKTGKNSEYIKKSGDISKDAAAKHAIMGYALMRVGSAFMEASRQVNAYIQSTIQASLDTGDIMGQVQALLNGSLQETTDRATALREIGKEISVAYAQDFKDIGTATYDAVSAFGDSENTMQKVNSAAMMAKAGFGQTSDAMELLISTQKSFGRQAMLTDDHIANLTFTTIKLGKTTLPELSKGMQAVSPFATQLGLDIQKTMASIIALAGTTGNTVNVATQLKGAFSQITRGAGSMKKVLDSLGYKDGKELFATNDTITAFKMLNSEAERLGISMEKLYGRKQATIAGVMLAGTAGEDYNKYLKELYDNEDSLKGALERVTKGINKNQEAYKVATQQIEIHKQTIGEKLMPVYAKVLDMVASIIGVISKFSPGIALMIAASSVVVGLAGFVMQAVGTFGMLTMAIQGSAMAATVFNVAIGGLAGIIALAAGATIYLYNESKKQKDVLQMQIDLQEKLKTETEEHRKELAKLLETYTRYGDNTDEGKSSVEELIKLYPTLTKKILETAKAYGVLFDVVNLTKTSEDFALKAKQQQSDLQSITLQKSMTRSYGKDLGLTSYNKYWNGQAKGAAERFIRKEMYYLQDQRKEGSSEPLFDIERMVNTAKNKITEKNYNGDDIEKIVSETIQEVIDMQISELEQSIKDNKALAKADLDKMNGLLTPKTTDTEVLTAWQSILDKINTINEQNKAGLINNNEAKLKINDILYTAKSDNIGENNDEEIILMKNLNAYLTQKGKEIQNPVIMALETKISSPFLTTIEQAQQAVDTYKAMAEEFYKSKQYGPDSEEFQIAVKGKNRSEQLIVDAQLVALSKDRAKQLKEVSKELEDINRLGLTGLDIEAKKLENEKLKQLLGATSQGQIIAITALQDLKDQERAVKDLETAIKTMYVTESKMLSFIMAKRLASLKFANEKELISLGSSIGLELTNGIIAGIEGNSSGIIDSIGAILLLIPNPYAQVAGGILTGIKAIADAIDGYTKEKEEKAKAAREKELKEYEDHLKALSNIDYSSSNDSYLEMLKQRITATEEALQKQVVVGQEEITESKKGWITNLNPLSEEGFSIKYGTIESSVMQDVLGDSEYTELQSLYERFLSDPDVDFYSERMNEIRDRISKIREEALSYLTEDERNFMDNMDNNGLSFAESLMTSMFSIDDPDSFEKAFKSQTLSMVQKAISDAIFMYSGLKKELDTVIADMATNVAENGNAADVTTSLEAIRTIMLQYEQLMPEDVISDINNSIGTESVVSTATTNTTNSAFSSTRVPDIYLTLTVEGSVIGTAGMTEFTDIMIDKIDERRGLSSNVTVIAS